MSNIDRSPCAEELVNREFSDKFESKSAGVGPLAEKEVNSTMIDWADIIFVMEDEHKRLLLIDEITNTHSIELIENMTIGQIIQNKIERYKDEGKDTPNYIG